MSTNTHHTSTVQQAKALQQSFYEDIDAIDADLIAPEAEDVVWSKLLKTSKESIQKRLEIIDTFLHDKNAPKYRTMKEWVNKRLQEHSTEQIAQHYKDLLIILSTQETPLYIKLIEEDKRLADAARKQEEKEAEETMKGMSKEDLVKVIKKHSALRSFLSKAPSKGA